MKSAALPVFIIILIASTLTADRPLTFEERVKAQEGIERVYYNHRIWPKDNPGPKPPFEQMIPRAQIEAKVTDYLKKIAALEEYWQKPVTPNQLQAELERIALHTKAPNTTSELFSALGNDPYWIAECLVRPIIADRMIHNLYSHDERFHAECAKKAERAMMEVSPITMALWPEGKYQRITYRVKSEVENGVAISPDLSRLFISRDEFSKLKTRYPRPWRPSIQENQDAISVEYPISDVGDAFTVDTLFFEKRSFDAWWAEISPDLRPIEPLCGTDGFRLSSLEPVREGMYWQPTSDSATAGCPAGRLGQTAVWTGAEMIVWGGNNTVVLNTGGRYNPATDSWETTSLGMNVPSPRTFHSAVWTGAVMIIWGGTGGGTYFNSGGSYYPTTNVWGSTSTGANVPAGRSAHTAVWTGSEMVVWGGTNSSSEFNSGGRYDLDSDSWKTTSTGTNVPSSRYGHTGVWTGSEMIIWGGFRGNAALGAGGKYNPSLNSWEAMATGGNAPSGRSYHTAVWTGTEMIVWGGRGSSASANTGGRYNPTTNTWIATATSPDAPSARYIHSAVWAETEMIVWGGTGGRDCPATGGRYDPISDSWSPTSSESNTPSPRYWHTGVWTGGEMIIWGGRDDTYALPSGGRYSPFSPYIPPTADFTWSPQFPMAGVSVQFTDQSTDHPTSWWWEFGDGYVSSEQNPSHIFTLAGAYQVTLIAQNAYGVDALTQQVTISANTPAPPISEAGTNLYIIPASAHAAGAAGTNWRTDMAIFNGISTSVAVNIYYLQAGKDNSNAAGPALTVSANNSLYVEDIIANRFGVSSGAGALLIGSNSRLLIASRTYNDLRHDDKGTYGQYIPGFPWEDGLTCTDPANCDEARLLSLQNWGTVGVDGFRSNLGAANASAIPATVAITIRGKDGQALVSTTRTLQPFGHDQFNLSEIPGIGSFRDGYAVLSISHGARVFAYASVVDNKSGDPVFMIARKTRQAETRVSGGSHARTYAMLLPAAAHAAGAAGTNWRTDLVIHNYSDATANYTIALLPNGTDNTNPQVRSYTLLPENCAAFGDIMMKEFDFNGSGALRITGDQPHLLVASRTYNDLSAEGRGTFGQYVPGFSDSALLASGDFGSIIQLHKNGNYRTNIGFASLSGSSMTAVVALYDGAGGALGEQAVTLEPYGYTQVNDIFGQMGITDVTSGYAEISSISEGAAYMAYASVVDNVSGDPVFMPMRLRSSAEGSWKPARNMNIARTDHQAVLLPTGKVLVAGGSEKDWASIGSAELYDPATGFWSVVGSLAEARNNFAAAGLSDGGFLVVGGLGTNKTLSSAEAYDVTTSHWRNAASLATARFRHTATRLADGRVLVVGGNSGGTIVTSAEIYNAGANSWNITGAMATGRMYHTATLLANGKVLVVGGSDNTFNLIATAEIYTPSTGIWNAGSGMAAGRILHTSTLLANGKVLVAGGWGNDTALRSVELYDPGTGTWSPQCPLATARHSHSATILENGNVLVVGGMDGNGNRIASAELYDAGTGTWSMVSGLATGRESHSAVLLSNGEVLVTGGSINGDVLGTVEQYGWRRNK